MEENWKYSFLSYVLDLIHLLEQKCCSDSNFRVKTMYESVKVLNDLLEQKCCPDSNFRVKTMYESVKVLNDLVS